MKATVEREIKLAVEPDFVFPTLAGEALPGRFFTSTYWDSAGRGLAGVGITLRHRVENGRGRWQLKIPHGLARLEIEVEGGTHPVPEELAALLVAFTRNGPLEPVATLTTRRNGRRIDDDEGSPLAEAVVDEVAVLDGRWVVDRFAELEVELVEGGGERDLKRIERALRAAGARDGDERPKLLRVLGVTPDDPDQSTTPGRLAAAIAAQRRTLLSRDPGTRLGTDVEDLHDMRVATRRVRSFLRTARPLVDPAWSEPLRDELKWLAGVLGEVRDLDVMLEHFEPAVETLDPAEREALAAGLLDRLRADRERAQTRLLTALSSQRYFTLLDRLAEPIQLLPDLGEAPTLPEIAAVEFKRLGKAMRRIDEDSPDEGLHAARIKGKRARYAAELAQPLAGKRVAKLLSHAKALQDVLGEHQDAFVAEDCIRRYLGTSCSAAAIGAGRLIERERLRRVEARRDLPAGWAELRKWSRKTWS